MTPAYRRLALSEITFAQRALVCKQLAEKGIKADCVVIADDENLDIARQYGFHTVERDNEFLGTKFNDGHEFAFKSGFDFSVPVGSDMFVDYNLFTGLEDAFTATQYYAVVKSSGNALITMDIEWGVLQFIPTRLMAPLDGRPCVEAITRSCDTHTRKRIKNNNNHELDIVYKRLHQFECVSFQSHFQITSFQRLSTFEGAKMIFGEPELIMRPLHEHYPVELLTPIVNYYKKGTSEKL